MNHGDKQMKYETLLINQKPNGIFQITLNRPDKLNVLSYQLLSELADVLASIKLSTEIKAVLLTGNGEKAFSAGADIKQMPEMYATQGLYFAEFGQHVFRSLEQLGKPSLAAINGIAFGGGCELSMSATIRIAATQAQFAQPEIKLGLIPGYGGTQRLARLIGKGRALDLCLTGRIFTADEAYAWGLVTEVVPKERLLLRAEEILLNLCEMPSIAMNYIMQAIDQGFDLPLAEALKLEAMYFGLTCATHDKHEGVSAFLEKRKPH